MNRSLVIAIVAFLILAGAGIWLLYSWSNDRQVEEGATQTYVSSEFGYSFEYPGDAVLEVYTPVALALDANSLGGFNAADAEVVLVTSGEDTYESYEDFVFDRTTTMCAADGPQSTIYCDEMLDTQPFTAATGLTGEQFSLQRVEEEFATGERETESFGPIFVFNISANLSEVQYAALVVRPPVTDSVAQINTEFVRAIAETVQIEQNEPAQAADLVLVSALTATGDDASVTFDRVEWLEGDAAVTAAVADTECTTANAETCVPSLANGFYIRNTAAAAETLPVTSDARLVLLDGTQPVTSTIEDVESRLAAQEEPLLAAVEVSNGTVVRIEEVYMP